VLRSGGRARTDAVQVVTFDIGDTLVRTARGSITNRLAEALAVPLPVMRAYFNLGAKRARQDVPDFIGSLCEHFAAPIDRPSVESILGQAAEEASRAPSTYPDALPVIWELARSGYYVCAISNLLGVIAPDLERTRADLSLDHVFYSCDVGYIKPEREIFRHVEHQFGLSADRFLHVGDSLSADVGGATSSGWRALHLRREGQVTAPAGMPRPGTSGTIATLGDLPRTLRESRADR
jgi:FMN phosphatase YigB (HAD superfamily)